jgi:hypothetical protein
VVGDDAIAPSAQPRPSSYGEDRLRRSGGLSRLCQSHRLLES